MDQICYLSISIVCASAVRRLLRLSAEHDQYFPSGLGGISFADWNSLVILIIFSADKIFAHSRHTRGVAIDGIASFSVCAAHAVSQIMDPNPLFLRGMSFLIVAFLGYLMFFFFGLLLAGAESFYMYRGGGRGVQGMLCVLMFMPFSFSLWRRW